MVRLARVVQTAVDFCKLKHDRRLHKSKIGQLAFVMCILCWH